MKQFVSVSLALIIFATTISLAQRRFGDGPVIVTLPQGFDTRSCQFKYFLVGSFGGYGGFVQPKLQVSEYEIETVHDGIAVEKLKAFLSCFVCFDIVVFSNFCIAYSRLPLRVYVP